jgi:hypothetical protein
MQFIEAQDAPFNCLTFIAIVKLENPHRKLIIFNRSFQFLLAWRTCDMKFEAKCNSKTFLRFHSLTRWLIKLFLVLCSFPFLSLETISCVTRTIVSNKLKNHLSKPERRKRNNKKGPRKRLNLCFICLSHKTTKSYATKLELTTGHSYPILVVLGRSSKREIYGGFSLCLLRELLNWTFICVIEKTKGVKQSFIIESEQKSFVVEQLNHPKGNGRTKGSLYEKANDNEQLFTYNSHPKLLFHCSTDSSFIGRFDDK